MIKFFCPNCKQKLGVPDEYAGWRVRCNSCGQPGVVPKPVTETRPQPTPSPVVASAARAAAPAKPQQAQQIELQRSQPPAQQLDELQLVLSEDVPPIDPNLEAIRQASRLRSQHTSDAADTDRKPEKFSSSEIVSSPPWYWPFVFPIKGAAMGMIGVFVLCEIIIFFVAILPVIGLIAGILSLIVRAYIYWYLYLCVQTAAEGKIFSPDILQEDEGDILGMIWRMIRMILAVFFCIAPAIIYFLWSRVSVPVGNAGNIRPDSIFWAMLAAGLFFLPMTLLSVVMNDSLSGLNPFVIVFSIARTLLKYLLLVVCFSVPLGLSVIISLFSNLLGFWFALPAGVASFYFSFVGAAMLGRFFYRNEKQLDWNV